MKSEIEWNKYHFQIEIDEPNHRLINIWVKDPSMGHVFPVFELQLIRFLPNENGIFTNGDYYQAVMNKGVPGLVDKKKSYAAIVHDFLLDHHDIFFFIKNIYSSPLQSSETREWMSVNTLHFWCLQMNKKPKLPVCYIKELKRFQLHLND